MISETIPKTTRHPKNKQPEIKIVVLMAMADSGSFKYFLSILMVACNLSYIANKKCLELRLGSFIILIFLFSGHA